MRNTKDMKILVVSQSLPVFFALPVFFVFFVSFEIFGVFVCVVCVVCGEAV